MPESPSIPRPNPTPRAWATKLWSTTWTRVWAWAWWGDGWAFQPTSPLARKGERIAARELKGAGYRILATNVRVQGGEADILAEAPTKDPNEPRPLVVIEVKTRRVGPRTPAPEASVTQAKRDRLHKVLKTIQTANNWTHRQAWIEVIAVEVTTDDQGKDRHTIRRFTRVGN
ncbi:MAG: YraN family protein [Phycisphaerales bacterium]|nr:MAG: YraN family protein [Phycisphaerales bacterium]